MKAVDQVDAAVKNFFALCAASSKCALNTDDTETTDSLLTQYDNYRSGLSVVEQNNLDNAFFLVLYDTDKFGPWATTLSQKYASQGSSQQNKRQAEDPGYNPLMFQTPNLAEEALAQIRCTDNQFRGSGTEDDYRAIDTGLQYTKYGAYPGAGNPKLCL